MNIRWNIILSIIAITLLAWFYSLNQEKREHSALVKSENGPEYSGANMHTTVFSPTGQKQYLATADQVEHYANNGETKFILPKLYLYELTQESPKQSWSISANNAILTKDNLLFLNGNVRVDSLLESRKLQKIETQSAVIDLKTQDISSDSSVKINGYNFYSTGLKLQGNLQQQIATLKEQVKTYYEIKR